MSLPLIAALIGAVLGAFRATRAGGKLPDAIMWGFGHACAFGVTVFAALVILDLAF